MPSVFDQKFKITFSIPQHHRRAVEKYLHQNVGGSTYYLHSRVGGKHWAVDASYSKDTVQVSVDDESLATYISLKFL